MKFVKAIVSLLLAVSFFYVLSVRWGPAPALGGFLSPFTGFWQNWERAYEKDTEISISSDSLRDVVTVRYDDMGVPHIFAQNDFDLFFAQGFVTAKDRLWQMDLQTRAASGRLSEVLGPATLAMDEKNRRMGMNFGAESNFKVAMSDKRSREALLGYTAGVNAYIDQLKPKDYPVEYKLLGYAPDHWKPIYTMYMLEQMTLTLAGRSDDVKMSHILKEYGQEVLDNLFPDYPLLQESPIIPAGTAWDFKRLPIPVGTPSLHHSDTLVQRSGKLHPLEPVAPKVEGVGSNNWAISAEKSLTGYPILANDPHLELTLPSIWYQVQLHAPGLNVYGVSLPGIPSVIIGFNKDIAWGVTNVDADVFDYYKIRFRDETQSEYWHDNQWKRTQFREEQIQVKDEAEPRVLKVVYTHHGPVFSETDSLGTPTYYSTRWIGREAGNSFQTFYQLNKAKNFEDYRQALSHYVGPAQNFIFADNKKDIAITVNGKFPLKYKNQGKFVLDGTNPTDDWNDWIPFEQNPYVKNPPRGYVSSANQSSTDPSYPYYINWEFAPAERGIRINERLDAMKQATGDSLRLLQTDNFSVLARSILPRLLDILKNNPGAPSEKAAANALEAWDLVNSPASIGAAIFETWIVQLRESIWEDEFGGQKLPMRYPSRDRTLYLLLNEPDASWFDDRRTPQKETMNDIVLNSFRASLETLTHAHGPLSPEWAWSKVKATNIKHLSKQLGPFDSGVLSTGGGSSIVNAITTTHGPSWRMVVELGPKPRGYGIYPGGQSGNPGSPYYLNMLDKWVKGELNELLFLETAEQQSDRLASKLIFNKK
ncbi:penicillin acylase family protein [Dyadobacter tibetensis]|uniref:penicillin acylase family protein n=1 Tax=Dyadobacter tibetensis TaxID=1211851 RepID=UPI000471DAC8|nr:penicillin acylase family protein [Dyadobacter tibetensis]